VGNGNDQNWIFGAATFTNGAGKPRERGLATVRGTRPPAISYEPSAEPLKDVWIALRANIRAVLERVTLADLAGGRLPAAVRKIAEVPANRE